MPDKDKAPPPPKRLSTFLNLAAPQPTFEFDPTKPTRRASPVKFTPAQLKAQALMMGLADLVRGATIGATGPEDTRAAQFAELVQSGIPLVKGVGLGLGAIQGGLKVLQDAPAAARGLYSRVDEALKLIPAKGAHPNKVASLLKSNASAEELAYRQVPQFLAGKGNATVTPAELAAHLAAHPAPMPAVKTLGGTTAWSPELERAWNNREFGTLGTRPSTPQDWMDASGRLERIAQQWQRNGDKAKAEKYFRLSEEATELAEGLDLGRGLPAGQPKYAQYQVPGGENYRETLLTMPGQPNNPYEAFVSQMERKYGEGFSTEALTADERATMLAHWNRIHTPGGTTASQFRSGHWDEPNVLVHTRANERTLPTGERGRFVEEVQSDWHQAGKREGYQLPPAQEAELRARYNALAAEKETLAQQRDPRTNVMLDEPRWHALSNEQDAIMAQVRGGVPDAPFKETWPDLGLKQQVLEAANDPNAQWIGHTSGATQAARYDLSKQIDELHYQPEQQRLLAFDKHADKAIDQIVPPEKLADYIGKEAAQKLLAQPFDTEYRTSHVLRGADLQVGGEGMQHFYDRLLPKRLEKILKPFGGTVERGAVSATEMSAHELADLNRVYGSQLEPETRTEPAWIARLTPEMKERIRREGLPLLSLLGAGYLWQAPNERPEYRQ